MKRKFCLLFNQPTVDITVGSTERSAYLNHFAPVGTVRERITFIVDLCKRLFGTTIEFELEQVDIVSRLYYGIGTSPAVMYFCLRKLSHEFEDEIEHHLIVALCLFV